MKSVITLSLSFLFLIFSTGLIAGEDLNCRSSFLSDDNTLSLEESVTKDFLSGLWFVDGTMLSQRNADEKVYQFDENGFVDIYTTDLSDRTSYEIKRWTVETFGDKVFLIMTETANSPEHLYEVVQTCEGIVLDDVSGGETLYLTFSSAVDQQQIDALQANLIGNWTTVSYPSEIASTLTDCGTFEEMKGAHVDLTFNDDGTFQRTIGNRLLEIVEDGIWSLSDNGQFIILHFCENGSPEDVYETSIISIEDMGSSDMTVIQSIETLDFQSFFCTPMKAFQFEKV